MGISKVVVFGIKQALKITIGVALTIAVFFGVGWLVDWNAGRKTPMPSDSKFLPYADSLKKKDVFTGMRQKTEQADSNHSFFETLKEQRREPAQIAQEQKQPPPAAQHKQPAAVPPAGQGAAGVELTTPAAEQEKADGQQTSAAPVTYTIQLGSFQNGDVAAAFSESLAGKGYPSHIVKIDVPGKGTVYRVRIGKYANMEEAQKVAVELEKKEKVSAFITSK